MTEPNPKLPPVGTPEYQAIRAREVEILALQLAQASRKPDLTSKVKLPALYPLQEQIKREARRYNCVTLGRRAGKTYLCTNLILEVALKGHPAGWFVPNYSTAAEVWRELTQILRPIATKANSTERRLELPNGGVIEVWTLENEDAGRGRKYKRVVVDEAAMARNLKTAWENAISPTLADLQGDAWFPSTPKGLNFYFDLFKRGSDDRYPDWKSWQLPSSVNPYLPPGEIDKARHDLPDLAFQQEWLAQFISSEGAVFRNVDACLLPDTPLPGEHEHCNVVAGVDWGQQNDYTAISVVCATHRREVFLDRFNKIDWHFQRGRIIHTLEAWKVRDCLCELNSIGSPNLEALRREVSERPSFNNPRTIRGFVTTYKSKGDIIRALSLCLEKEQAKWLADEAARFELLSYEQTITKHGNSQFGASEGNHDDTVIARALAWDAAKRFLDAEESAERRIQKKLPETWTDKYLDQLNAKDPVTAQRYYLARTATLKDLKATIRHRPAPDYSGDADWSGGREDWTD